VGNESTRVAVRGPVSPSSGALRPLGLDEVRLLPGFWGDRQELNAAVILDHCHDWMTREGWIGNFTDAAAGRPPGAARGSLGAANRHGFVFSDSEIYKVMEGMSWEAERSGREPAALGELTELIAAAQEDDGYVNTHFGRQGRDARYRDLEWGHELYCSGFLITAAIARLRTHGDDRLVQIARRAADHICREFAERPAVCGHPEIEMALVELCRATGDDRYLEQAKRFVEWRGRPALADIQFGRAYFQDDMPVRSARVLRGHAVRALYLASGAVDVAVETGDDALLQVVIEQWERTVAARTYLTGGMGSRHTGEAFGEDFELPPDRAYAETCAGIASVQLCWRLLLATGDARYADLAERTLYNIVAAAPAIDGRAFFYANPLHQRVPGQPPRTDVINPRADASLRAPWFHVSCCPTNLARTFASLAGYVATSDAQGVQLHQLTPCTVRTALPGGRTVGLRVDTGYPWTGALTVRIDEAPGGPWRIGLRVPAWAEGATLSYGDGRSRPVRPGTVTLEETWRPGDELRLDLPLSPRWTRPDPRIDAVRGCVALERGPLVYCVESTEPDTGQEALAVDTGTAPAAGTTAGLGDAVTFTGTARSMAQGDQGDAAWPYGAGPPTPSGSAPPDPHPLTFVPYHLWGNRGPATMRVWLPEAR
jgi:uncharacterized protein